MLSDNGRSSKANGEYVFTWFTDNLLHFVKYFSDLLRIGHIQLVSFKPVADYRLQTLFSLFRQKSRQDKRSHLMQSNGCLSTKASITTG